MRLHRLTVPINIEGPHRENTDWAKQETRDIRVGLHAVPKHKRQTTNWVYIPTYILSVSCCYQGVCTPSNAAVLIPCITKHCWYQITILVMELLKMGWNIQFIQGLPATTRTTCDVVYL